MCRFVAYFGKKTILLNEVLKNPVNSLINQSKHARLGVHGLNADGVGLGWYDLDIEETPALYKSIQPAWNDPNLLDLSSKIKSNCFIAHVRASTVGDVTTLNCHPFRYQKYLFAHNGTIRDFNTIKQPLIQKLKNAPFMHVRGQTDSEFFFALIQSLYDPRDEFLPGMEKAIKKAIKLIAQLKEEHECVGYTRLNTILTDGKNLIATRYATASSVEPITLYYAVGAYVENKNGAIVRQRSGAVNSLLIASEPLTDCMDEWTKMPSNSILRVGQDFKVDINNL